MAITIELSDLGPSFADVDEALFEMWLEAAMAIVLGEPGGWAAMELRLAGCGIDITAAVKSVLQHLLASDSSSGAEGLTVTNERVGQVSASYAAGGPSSPMWKGTPYGILASTWMFRIARCLARRNKMPGIFSTKCGCVR